jgi:hypothetical protein
VYHSAWLQRSEPSNNLAINDNDIYSLMSCLYGLNKGEGLDLILHTAGGGVAVAEAIGSYLRNKFAEDIVVIVPQLAMSAGTMIACSAKAIIMGAHSSLSPIDPQFGGTSSHGVITEFNRAKKDIEANPLLAQLWAPILQKYPPAFIGECENAMNWAKEFVGEWLISGMFKGDKSAKEQVNRIVSELSDHDHTKSHSRHISADKCADIGLKVVKLEGTTNQELQDTILSVYHAYTHTMSAFPNISKIIENHNGQASVSFS